jgi:hypothetical protein
MICELMGGHLGEFHSEEFDYVTQYLTNQTSRVYRYNLLQKKERL